MRLLLFAAAGVLCQAQILSPIRPYEAPTVPRFVSEIRIACKR